MLRHRHQTFFRKSLVFGKHSINSAAKSRIPFFARRGPVNPFLKKAPRHRVALLEPGNARANFLHHASAIRQRNQRTLQLRVIQAAHHQVVAKIQRSGRHLHQHLSVRRLLDVPLNKR